MNRETLRCICGREVGIVRLNAETLTFGHRTNPGLASHPVRLAPTSRDGADRELLVPERAREDLRPHREAPVSRTGYQVRRRVSLSTPAPHSHDPSLAQAGRPRVRGVHDGSPSQPFRPSEGASLKRGPSLAPTHPLSAATRSTPPGRS